MKENDVKSAHPMMMPKENFSSQIATDKLSLASPPPAKCTDSKQRSK